MDYNLLTDLSTLTTIPVGSLMSLADKSVSCICQDIAETFTEKDTLTTIDVGIGTLSIFLDGDSIKYKFIPTRKLEKSILETIQSGKSPLLNELEDAVTKRILRVYKDLF